VKKLFALIALLGASLMAAEKTVFDFTLNSIDGQPAPLSAYKGKVVLLVNVASRCGYTPQYAGLESLYEKYKDLEQLRRPGAWHQSGDQNLLHLQISRHLSHDVESFR
jgi:hypothetical protein